LEQFAGHATHVLVAKLKIYPGLQIAHDVVEAVADHEASNGSQTQQLAAVHATHVAVVVAARLLLTTNPVAQVPAPTLHPVALLHERQLAKQAVQAVPVQ